MSSEINADVEKNPGVSGHQKAVAEKIFRRRTSNGFDIYYDETYGDSVGIVYKNLVFLKKTSNKRLDWFEAEKYCKTITVNCIVSDLCPVTEEWKEEFKGIHYSLFAALVEIGADNLYARTWCSEFHDVGSRCQNFVIGNTELFHKMCSISYVRPVLILK